MNLLITNSTSTNFIPLALKIVLVESVLVKTILVGDPLYVIKMNTGKFTKGQIMSESVYEIIDFPKYHRKNLIDFCPEGFID